MRAVGYSKIMSPIPRYNDVSLKEQNDRIRDFAKKNRWKLVGFYDDRRSDVNSDIGFKKLQEDGIKRQFDVVIIDSIFRCGKNVSYARELLQNIFYPAGIHFVILEDDINSFEMTPEEVSDYFFSARQKANSIIGKDLKSIKLAETGELSTDKECYGYLLSWDRKELVIDEEAASVIRTIFQMYSDGYRTSDIWKYLNERHIDIPAVHLHKVAISKPPCYTNAWSKSQLSSIRKNRRYAGAEINLGYRTVKYPAIVSKELFDKVYESHKGKPHGENSRKKSDFENAFFQKVYLKSDGQRLSCAYYKLKDGYYFRKTTVHKGMVAYSEVEDKVRDALRTEKSQCEQIMKVIKSQGGSDFIDMVRDVYDIKMKEIIDQMDELIVRKLELFKNHEIQEINDDEYDKSVADLNKEIEGLNDAFNILLEDSEGKLYSLSQDNPWIKRFINIDVNMAFTIQNMKDLVERINISSDGEIEVILNSEGKSKLPVCWRTEDA